LDITFKIIIIIDRQCGLVITVLDTVSEVMGLFPGADFLISGGSGTGSTQPREDN
jgi:hypothetical protein